MDQKEYLELKKLFEKEGQYALGNIANVLNGNLSYEKEMFPAVAYVLWKAQSESVSLSSLELFCTTLHLSTERRAFFERYLANTWSMLEGMKNRFSSDVLKSIILFFESWDFRKKLNLKAPDSIIRLANMILRLSPDDAIANFGMGNASFMIESFFENPQLSFYGNDIDATIKEISEMQLEIVGCKSHLECCDYLNLDAQTHQYDKIFSVIPFGIRTRYLMQGGRKIVNDFNNKVQNGSQSGTTEWLFCAALMECLKENGLAIAVIPTGCILNSGDRAARQYFVEKGYLQAVITLPERMFENTAVSSTMLVLSYGNKKTMFVDATSICEKGRRFNSFTDEHIQEIVQSILHESDNSFVLSSEEIRNNEYILNPAFYHKKQGKIENGIPFSACIKTITRGAPIRASELDTMVSEQETECQYLMLANIQKGQIDANLPYLKEVADNWKKYCLKNRALILSKNGPLFKVAVAEVEEGKQILANGNLFIIEIDETKANPYFMKAFFESPRGTTLLKSIAVGTMISSIGVDSLKKLEVPNAPLEAQVAFEKAYRQKLTDIQQLEKRLEDLYTELNGLGAEWY